MLSHRLTPDLPASLQNANVGSYSNEGFVEVLAATQSPISTSWFQVGGSVHLDLDQLCGAVYWQTPIFETKPCG